MEFHIPIFLIMFSNFHNMKTQHFSWASTHLFLNRWTASPFLEDEGCQHLVLKEHLLCQPLWRLSATFSQTLLWEMLVTCLASCKHKNVRHGGSRDDGWLEDVFAPSSRSHSSLIIFNGSYCSHFGILCWLSCVTLSDEKKKLPFDNKQCWNRRKLTHKEWRLLAKQQARHHQVRSPHRRWTPWLWFTRWLKTSAT